MNERYKKTAIRSEHGMSASNHDPCVRKFYRIWSLMKNRCLNKRDPSYKDYGGRGILVCEDWLSFPSFCRDMWDLYVDFGWERASIDRIDNNGCYTKSNCRWNDASGQARNRRTSRLITLNGITKTLADWSEETGLKRTTISQRIVYGWPIEKALTQQLSDYVR